MGIKKKRILVLDRESSQILAGNSLEGLEMYHGHSHLYLGFPRQSCGPGWVFSFPLLDRERYGKKDWEREEKTSSGLFKLSVT